MKRVRWIAAGMLLAVSAYPQAQSNAGAVEGVLTDASGGVIAKAQLSLTGAGRGVSRKAATDAQGAYHFGAVPPGRYDLRAEAQGFAAKTLEGVEVRVGDALRLDIAMVVGAISTEIKIMADAPVVETERYQQADTIELQRLRDLPVNRRNYMDLALLSAGTAATSDLVDGTDYRVVQTPQSGVSFGGGNGRGNNFMIDGVENFINTGGVRLSVSQEAVQEFQINRNTASAEFGWSSGGAVNVVTKSGTNDVHGGVFGFLRHRSIQARNYFDPVKSAFTRDQSGATLGGPLRKDKTFLFGAYERLDRHETSFVTALQDPAKFGQLTPSQQQLTSFFGASGVPQLAQVGGLMKQALTPANNPRLMSLFNRNSGQFPFGEGSNLFSTRLDHQFSSRHNFYFRGNLGSDKMQNAQSSGLIAYNRGRAINQWDGTAMVNDTLVVGGRWVFETRAMFNFDSMHVIPTDPHGPEINITGYGYFGREIFLPSHLYERHYQIIENVSYHSGRHDWRMGVDINPVRDRGQTETFFSGRFSFGEAVPLASVLASATRDPSTPAQLAAALTAAGKAALVKNLSDPITALQAYSLGLPTYYQQGFGNPEWRGWSKRYGMFVQDTWRPTGALTLNFGLRYDLEVNEAVLGTDPNNFTPRFGFAWTPTRSRTFVVRGGYGLYTMPTNLQVANIADALSGRYINQVFIPLTGIPGINNPLTGRPTTSADVFQGLSAKGIIGTRTVTPADLAPYGVRVGPGMPLRVEFGSDKVRNGYAQQGSFELERAFGDWAVSAAYNFNRTLGIARITGRNLFYTGQVRADGSPVYGRFDPTLLQKNIFTYDGNSSYHAGIVQVQRRLRQNLMVQGHYTFSKAMDDVTDFNSDFSPMDQLNKRGEHALSAFHHKHRLVVNALYESPLKAGRGRGVAGNLLGGWTVAPIVQANSWRPFNVLAGNDVNGDGYVTNDRPYGLGRNTGQGPNNVSFDLRLSRRIGLGRETRALVFTAEGFNLFNRTNFRTVNNTAGAVPIGALPRPIQGLRGPVTEPFSYTSAYDPRQFQFGLKLVF